MLSQNEKLNAIRDGWLMAKLASAAYQKDGADNAEYLRQLKLEVRALGLDFIDTFEVDDLEGFIVSDSTRYIEVFRGTDEKLDWIRNAMFFQIPSPLAGKVHGGFSSSLDVLWKGLQEHRSIHANGKLHLTAGHSLGGAIATLAFARCLHEGVNAVRLFTFGAPRVGDPDFTKFYNEKLKNRSFRFVNKIDLVPAVPLHFLSIRSWVTKYEHTGIQLYLNGHGGCEEIEPSNWVQGFRLLTTMFKALYLSIKNREWPWFSLQYLCKARLDDHSMYSYISSINSALPELESPNLKKD